MRYCPHPISWENMLDLIRSKQRQQVFWDFIEQLRQVRLTFNKVLMAKFKSLPRFLKKNDNVQLLFNKSVLKVDAPLLDD